MRRLLEPGLSSLNPLSFPPWQLSRPPGKGTDSAICSDVLILPPPPQVETIEDPIAPVELILERCDKAKLQEVRFGQKLPWSPPITTRQPHSLHGFECAQYFATLIWQWGGGPGDIFSGWKIQRPSSHIYKFIWIVYYHLHYLRQNFSQIDIAQGILLFFEKFSKKIFFAVSKNIRQITNISTCILFSVVQCVFSLPGGALEGAGFGHHNKGLLTGLWCVMLKETDGLLERCKVSQNRLLFSVL